MKIINAYYVIFILVFFSACSGISKREQEELDSLRNIVESQKKEIEIANSFVILYNTNMNNLLNANDFIHEIGESDVISEDKIKEKVNAVNMLLEEQRSKIQELQEMISQNKSKYAKQIKEALGRMQAQLDAKDAEIRKLKEKIDAKNINIAELKSDIKKMESDISNLNKQTKEQEEALVAQNELLNTGYIVMGTAKELKAKGLLSGGLFSKKKINKNGVDENKFQKVDMRTNRKFVIPAKKAQIITPMPIDSYTITPNDNNTCNLTITDVGRFWSQTPFLIISY